MNAKTDECASSLHGSVFCKIVISVESFLVTRKYEKGITMVFVLPTDLSNCLSAPFYIRKVQVNIHKGYYSHSRSCRMYVTACVAEN